MSGIGEPLVTRGSTKRFGPDGFILVETLVTMAISAFLLVAIASLLSLTLRSFDRSEQAANATEQANRTFAALARDIRGAAWMQWAGKERGMIFVGTAERLVYAYDAPTGPASTETRVVDLQAMRSGPDFRLTRREGLLPPDAGGLADIVFGPPVDLLSGRRHVSFSYFGSLAGGNGEVLTDDWLADDRLPVAVRVTLTPDRADRRPLSLRIPLMTSAEPGCAAPERSFCSIVAKEDVASDSAGEGAPGQTIDPNDSAGWARYAQ